MSSNKFNELFDGEKKRRDTVSSPTIKHQEWRLDQRGLERFYEVLTKQGYVRVPDGQDSWVWRQDPVARFARGDDERS